MRSRLYAERDVSGDKLKAGTAVTVSGGALAASLAAKTVTTFVCK